MADLLYHLNASDEIASVNEEWAAFARANDGADLDPARVVGRSLWDFVGDVETQHIYRQLHQRVRTRRHAVRLTFRCDAPDRRRLLQLTISAARDQTLLYRVRTAREQPRQPLLLLEPRCPRSETFVTMCGWCKRVAAPPRRWLEIEDAVTALSLFAEPHPPQLTHGICETCDARLNATVKDESVDFAVGEF